MLLVLLFLSPVSGSLRGSQSSNATSCISHQTLLSDKTGYYSQLPFQSEILSSVSSAYGQLRAAVESYRPPDPKSGVTRAVTGYLPGGNAKYLKEFRLLLLSVGVMRGGQSPQIRTDVVVFTDEATADSLLSLGCRKELRRNKEEPELCIIVIHESLKSKHNDDPLDEYPNADSIDFIVHLPNPDIYDFILRGDLDTFVTPGFAEWIPNSKEFLFVGHGGYGAKEAVARLRSIARELQLPYGNIHDVGSTWYGATKVVIALSAFSTALMRYLATNAFTEYERCCNGVDGWPRWHRPVISMYSGDLAVNALKPEQVRRHGDGFYMDHGSDQTVKMTQEIKHIHCWHTRSRFSKFVFAEGGYDQLDLTPFLAMDTPADFATVVGVSAARLTDEELRDILADPEALKARKWLRVTP